MTDPEARDPDSVVPDTALDAIAEGACIPGGEGSSPIEPVQVQSMKVLEA